MAKARIAGIALAAAAMAAMLTAQQDDRAPLPVPTFRAEANYVRVDVFPTTRDGAAVTDLTAADFELVEDRAPQKIEQFERVLIRAAGSGEGRPEPNTVAESKRAIQDPRARVFVLFLDPKHVEQAASRTISQTLVNALNRLIGPDDYVGVMLPQMKLSDVTFARRTVAIENLLRNDWWGKRDSTLPADEVEEQYNYCYQTAAPAIGQEMILRHREQETFDALEELVVNIRNLREERKAVLAITDGWMIYRPNPNLTRPLTDPNGNPSVQPPGAPPLGIDPRSGKLSTAGPNDLSDAALRKCELDRQTLSNLDDESRLRTIIDEANRSNTSFYPVDPRGLVVFDEGIVPSAQVGSGASNPTLSPQEENRRLMTRADGLRRLAEGTDGTAIVGTNNIAAALRRIVDDLSSYYLLGYYSTGKLDGKFHSITVRVKRPGITVRARRGYQAMREGDIARANTAPKGAAPAPTAEAAFAAAASSAVAKVVNNSRDLPLRVHVTAGWRPGANGQPVATFWTVGEVVDRIPGAELDAVLLNGNGDIVSSVHARIAPGTTSAIVQVVPDPPPPPGDYTMRVRSQTPAGAETMSMPVKLGAPSQASGAVFIRRGPTTGNKEMPTADLRFHRSERMRVEVPSSVDVTTARLLDRTGKPIGAIPVTASTRTDADGTRWATGELLLAPLAPGDYIVEVVAGDTRTLAAFRIVL
jgi:VWFA-related protein